MVAACAAGAAEAAPARIQFRVGPQAYSEALLDIAQQANITLIGAAACPGQFRGQVDASMTLEQVLGQVLTGAPCTWRLIAPGAVEVSPGGAAAETVRPSPPVTVGELLVTATKRVRNPRELAVAVTAIPRADLHAAGANDAAEAAGQLAGVLATNLGPGRNKLLLRGLSDGAYTGRARSIVATYLDDIPVNYNAPDPDFRLVDIERVEVARGPQGALYGAGSISGVYRLVSRKPDLDDFSTEIRATGADTRSGARSYAVEGHVNLPVLGDMLGARVAGYEEIQGGYLDDTGQMRDNVDRTARRGGRLILLFHPSDAWMISATVAGQHLRSEDTHYTTPGLGLTRRVRIPEPHVNDIALATATVRRSWGGAELTASTGFIRHAYGSLYDATATQQNYTQTRDGQTSAYSERTVTRMLVQDLFLSSRGAGQLEWLAGVYGSDTRTKSPTEFLVQVPRAPNALVYGDQRRDHIRELAAYGEASYHFAPGWMAAAGGRVFHINTRTESDVVSERFPPRGFDREVNFTGFSPKISVQYEYPDGDLVYGVISEGYRSGGINSGGALPLPPQREDYRPDRLLNYELGFKGERFDRRLALNAALFYAHWKNIQTDQFRPSGIAYTTNAGDAHIVGMETEMAWRTDWGLTAQLNGRYSRIRTSNGNLDLTPNLANGLPGAPPFSAGGLVSYEREVFGDWTLRFVGQATYIGRSRVTFDARQPSMGNYTRTKLSAELAGPHVGVQLYMINPLDARGDTFAFGNPFNPDQTRQITPQRPRTVGVTISAAL